MRGASVFLLTLALTPAFRAPAAEKPEAPPESILITPEGEKPETPLPLLVFLHGHGDTVGNASSWFREFANSEKSTVLCVSGSVRVPGEGWTWSPAADEPRVLAEIDRVSGKRKTGNVYLAGFSAGGQLAYRIGLGHPDRFKGIIPIGGWIPWLRDARVKPPDMEKARPLPVYLIHGREDAVVPFARAEECLKHLRDKGLSSGLFAWGGGHTYPPGFDEELAKAIRFIDAHAAKDPAR